MNQEDINEEEIQKALAELKVAVNNILTSTFKEEALDENSYLWSIILNEVPDVAEEEQIPLIVACNYILLINKGSSNSGNTESFSLGNASYSGPTVNTNNVNIATNILNNLGYSFINFGVVNGN